jgi:PAS domain S-box-containing protein
MSAEKQKTVLLVDDEAIIAMTEKMALEKYGYNVIIAHTGEDAVVTIAKTPAIDLVLMDINLGAGIDGTEAAALILSNRDLPVVFLSSHMEPEVVAKTEKITSYGYVVKNSSITVLDASIKMAFKLFEAKTKEQEKEKALRESEASYRVMFSGASDGILLADSQTKQFRYANQAICRLMGYTEEELLRISIVDIHPKESLDRVLAEFAALARGEIRSSPDLPCLRKDGTIFYADISHRTVILEGREYSVGFFHDITARKQAEEVVFQSKKDWEDSFDSITDMITVHDNDYNIVRANKAGIALLKLPEFEKNLKIKCFSFYHGTDAPPAGCPSCDCLKNGTPGVFELFEPHLDRYLEIRALPRFDSNNQRAGIIHIVRDITVRKLAEQALHESEERLRDILFSTADWIWEVDEKGVYTYSSDKGQDLLGVSRGDIIGKTPFDFMPPEEVARVAPIFSDIVANKRIITDLENWNLGRNGEPICLLTNGVPILDKDGNLKGYRGLDQDITERKRAEEQLRYLSSVVENISDSITVTNANFGITYINKAGEKIFGYTLDELKGKTPDIFNAEPMAEQRQQELYEIVSLGKTYWGESLNRRKDGSTFYCEYKVMSLKDSNGKIYAYSSIQRDITERKRAESQMETALAALKENNSRLAMAMQAANMAWWEMDLASGNVVFEKRKVEMLDFPPEKFTHYKDFMALVHPEDHERAMAAMRGHIEGSLARYEVEYRISTRSGEFKWFYDIGSVVKKDANGKPLKVAGLVINITRRKQAEKLAEALYEISQSSYSTGSLHELFKHVHRALSIIIPTNNLFIALISDDGKVLNFPYNIDEKDSGAGSDIEMDNARSLAVEVCKTKKHLLLNETELFERYASGRNKVWGAAPKCWLGVPLMVKGTVIGVLAVQDYHKGSAYNRKDVSLLESAAGQIAIAIDRKRAEARGEDALKALHESEERFHSLFDNMDEGVALHELVFAGGKPVNYRIVDVNNRFLKIVAVSREHMIGRLATEAFATAVPPYLAEYAEVGVDKKTFHFETYFAQMNKHFAISVAPWRESGFATIFTDISERKQAEEALRINEAKQSNALQMTKAGHWEYDVDRDLFTFNDNFYRIFRTTAAAVGGYQMSSENYARKFCHPDDMAMVGDETRKAIESTDPNYSRQVEQRILYADGQVGYITVRFFLIKDPQGRTVKTYGVNQDISERKWAEMEITRQLAEKEILLREVHHRIKNNIAAIGGLLSLHLKSVANPQAVAALQDAIGRVDSMGILYDKLLLTEGYKDVSVKNYLESLADMVIALFPGSAKIKLEKHVIDFQLDSKRLFPLGIILNELLTNKMKYAFKGKAAGKIMISLALVDHHVKLIVKDNGTGLPEDFDVNASKGFGLMLVKMLSQQLGGSFSVEKHAGTPCTVEFDI